MKNLLTDKELIEVTNYFESLQQDKYYHIDNTVLSKLLFSYKYYKDLVTRLETKFHLI